MRTRVTMAAALAGCLTMVLLVVVAVSRGDQRSAAGQEVERSRWQGTASAASARTHAATQLRAIVREQPRARTSLSRVERVSRPAMTAPAADAAPNSTLPLHMDGRTPVDATREELISVLMLPDLQPNQEAIQALLENHSDGLAADLLSRLQSGTSPFEVAVVTALGALGDGMAVSRLAELASSPNSTMREACWSALGQIQDPAASYALAEQLSRNSNPQEQQLIVGHIQHAGDSRLAAEVTRFLDSPDRRLRREAVSALGRLGSAQSTAALSAVLLDDGDRYVRRSAARALGAISDPRSQAILTSVLQSDEDRGVKRNIAEALAAVGDLGCVDVLRGAKSASDHFLNQALDEAIRAIEARHAHR